MSIKDSRVVNNIVALRIIDNIYIDHTNISHILHIEHVQSLVVMTPYWDLIVHHLKVVLHVAFTR